VLDKLLVRPLHKANIELGCETIAQADHGVLRMLFTVVKFTHLLSLLLLFCSSLAKNLLVAAKPIDAPAIARCRTADRVSGGAAGIIVLTGIAMIYGSPKGAGFYTSNPNLWIKVAVLVIASALIVRTKVFFRSAANVPQSAAIGVPAVIPWFLKVDLASLVVMTYLGVLVAYGIGFDL
jgi:uncharacterized membrane protein